MDLLKCFSISVNSANRRVKSIKAVYHFPLPLYEWIRGMNSKAVASGYCILICMISKKKLFNYDIL